MSPRVILITGANSGIGFATAKVMAHESEGFHIILACRSLEKAKGAISDLAQENIKAQLSPVQLDVTDEDSIKKAAAYIRGEFARLDVLINNAGTASQDPDLKTRYQQCLDINVIGPALVSAAFRDLLLQSPSPYSIYVSTAMGSLTLASDPSSPMDMPGWRVYSVSKTAVNMVAAQEALEVKDTPMKVFAVCPGLVRSNIRGMDEDARNCGGMAGDPLVSGRTILDIVQGCRDKDAGRLVHKDGVYPW